MNNLLDGFVYSENVLSEAEQQQLLQHLGVLDYRQDQFRGKLLKRSAAHFGYTYLATGRRLLPAASLPPFLVAVIDKCLPYCPPGSIFNQCLVTKYPPGAGIGWHVDAPQFGEYIVAVSLGEAAQLKFRQRGQEEGKSELGVAPRSVYLLSGPARWKYQHCITPVKRLRYSLTFRYVALKGKEEIPFQEKSAQ